jgi:hypothetical protein
LEEEESEKEELEEEEDPMEVDRELGAILLAAYQEQRTAPASAAQDAERKRLIEILLQTTDPQILLR